MTIVFLLLFFFPAFPEQNSTLPKYNLSVAIFPKENRINGTANIFIQSKNDISISFGDLKINSIFQNGAKVEIDKNCCFILLKRGGKIEIEYEGMFPEKSDRDNINNPGNISNIISDKGISLTKSWYPRINANSYFNLKVTAPDDFKVISEADQIIESSSDNRKLFTFEFPHPVDDITLAANRYEILQSKAGDTDIYIYFLKDNIELASRYIKYTKKYIDMYERLLGPYPYKRFSVVENIKPTGYSMPSYTLIGSNVIRLPFIAETSLGHEVLHQWFGNSVYIDHSQGNWAEGITSYLADHYYYELDNKGWRYRKKILQDYISYVKSSNKSSLIKFKSRTDRASGSIGYGKGAMMFHMLRGMLGDKMFFDSLKSLINKMRFKETSWQDIQKIFEGKFSKSLDWFFQQWLNRDDIPSLKIDNTSVHYLNGIPTVKFTITQLTKPYKLDIEVFVNTIKRKHKKTIHISKLKEIFEIAVDDTPVSVVFDENYNIMRTLSQEELPPTISGLIGDKSKILITKPDMSNYEGMFDLFKTNDFKIKSSKDVKDKEILSSSLVLTDIDGIIYKRLFAGITKKTGQNSENIIKNRNGFRVSLRKHPLNSGSIVALINASSKKEVDLAAKKIFRYGQYSNLVFNKGKIVQKAVAASQRGIVLSMTHNVKGIIPGKAIGFDEIIRDVINKPIIYIGESHTSYEDHRVQLEVIRALYKKSKKFAIGMEMFQRPFQVSIDNYLSGKISEKEFLKTSEYFTRWRFDYFLYKEIVDYAKAKGIPILALNIDSNIIKKVSKGGLDALNHEERNRIPTDMDMSDSGYKKRLKKIYKLHPEDKTRNFNNFYQSQILWDETMAHTIAEYMQSNPDHHIIVLAGVGHIMYSSGIPQRVKRINGIDYSTLINSNISVIDRSVADYILFPEPLKAPKSPMLGVAIKKDPQGVIVDKIIDNSLALKAGIKKGDIILKINNDYIETTSDIKISLIDSKRGDSVKVKVLRKGFLFGKEELEFQITIP